MLAQIEWLSDADAERVAREWTAIGTDEAREAARGLRSAGMRELWARPKSAKVEIMLDGEWISGVFDRVVVERDASGRAERATVYDFKTDKVSSDSAEAAAARHAHQIELYRRVLAVLTGLPSEKVAGSVVFTKL
jgi:ATP-dependent helicase/nuclease subunit A